MIIYKTTNLLNGKIYVGKDVRCNPNYFGSGILLIRAIKKYGKKNFIKEIIGIADTKEELNEKEKYWIKFYNCKVPSGYNLTDGGDGNAGYIYTEEDRKKMSEAKKGRPSGREGSHHSEETKEKIGENRRGKLHSQETKKRIRESMRGKNKGRRNLLSQETKEKISEALKGKNRQPKSEETKRRMREAQKGKPSARKGSHHSEETKEKIRLSLKERRNKYKKSEVSKCMFLN